MRGDEILKKAILGLGMILIMLGVTAGIFGWTAITLKERTTANERQEAPAGNTVTAREQSKDGIVPAGQQNTEDIVPAGQQGTEDAALEEQQTDMQNSGNGMSDGLAYNQLDAEMQQTYDEILKACEEHLEEIRLTTLDKDMIEKVYQAVICDHGGFFWVNGYTCTLHTVGKQVRGIDFRPAYTFSLEERENYQKYVEEAAADYLSYLSPDASDYEKVKYIYEMLIHNVKYNAESEENQNILSVFLFGESVCSGFASAAQYLLDLLDVPCMIVYGVSQGEPHAWNLVYLEGEPYFFDVTWGSTLSETIGDCSYAYLNLTSQDIEKTHQIDMLLDIPECTSVTDSYYTKEDRFFAAFEETSMGELLERSYKAGEKTVAFKFASDDLYQQAYQTFIADAKFAEYCPGLQRIGYIESQELRVLTFQWR